MFKLSLKIDGGKFYKMHIGAKGIEIVDGNSKEIHKTCTNGVNPLSQLQYWFAS